MNVLTELFTDYTLRNVALGSAFLGIVSGVLGAFAVLRRQGLMGDALSHAALPGVCAAFMITGSKAPVVLMVGAAIAGWLGMLLIHQAVRKARVDQGSALGVVLTVFFGFGVVLLTVIQKGSDANQAGLDKFLFGQAAALTADHVLTMAVVGGTALLIVALLFKEFKVVSFDPEFAGTLGFDPARLGLLLTALLVFAIVIGLNTVGVVLMSAMLVAPAAAARQWTESLAKMVVLAAAFGAAGGVAGALASVTIDRVPTGPAIVLILAAFALISIFFGSARGLVWQRFRQVRAREASL